MRYADSEMTRGQYLAMCLIGAVAIIACMQSYRISLALQRISATGGALKPGNAII